MVDLGIRQFFDLGAAIPTARAVHEIARARDPAARVAHVENEPVAVAHSRAPPPGGCAVISERVA